MSDERQQDRSWVGERDTIQGNCDAYAQAIEAGLPDEMGFVLMLFPKKQGGGAALAGRGTATEVSKALKAGLDSANRIRNREGGRIVLPG